MVWGWDSVNRDGYSNQVSGRTGRGGSPPKKGCGGKKRMFGVAFTIIVIVGSQLGAIAQLIAL